MFGITNSLSGVLILTLIGSVVAYTVIATFIAFIFKLNSRKKTKESLIDQYWSSKGLKSGCSGSLKQ